MMLGVNSTAILMTSAGLIVSGDIPKIMEFFHSNPTVLQYNVITAITSAFLTELMPRRLNARRETTLNV